MYHTILHPTDLQENHFQLCEKAAAIAKRFEARLILLHVIQPPTSLQFAQSLGFAEFDKPIKDDALAVLKVVAESLNVPSSQLLVEVGSIKQHILDKTEELACDLIIIGNHNESSFHPFLGSTAHAIVHHARCDVITLKST